MAQRKRTTRDSKKEPYWREHLARQAASGMNIVQWCRQNGVSASLFHYWKRALARRDGRIQAPKPEPTPAAPAAPLFAQVVLTTPPPAARPLTPDGGAPIEIIMEDSRVVRVRPGFDAPTLARVLAVLEGRAC
jgi:transposase-like protein